MRHALDTDPTLARIGDKVSIRRRGKKGTYIAEFFHDGQHRRRSLKTARADLARQRAIKLEADLAAGEYKPRSRLVSLEEAKEEFLTSKRGEGLKPKSIVKYTDWIGAFVAFAATLDVRFLQQCTPVLFEKFRAFRQPTQKPKSMYTGLIIVKQFFKFFSGGSRDYLPINPIARCKVRAPYVAPQFTPTPEQLEAIMNATKGMRKYQFAMAAFTGIREEELAMLSPGAVDLKNGWVHIIARDNWIPKTSCARKIPIHPRLATLLAELKTNQRAPYFFCAPASKRYPNGDHHLNVRQINEDVQTIAKKLGIPVGRKNEGMVFHSFRHYFETQCVNSGVPQFVVDAWMGHTKRSMGKIYYTLTDAKSQEFMRQVKF